MPFNWLKRTRQTERKYNVAPIANLRVIPLRGGTTVSVVGESFYQEALETLAGGKTYDGVHMPVTALLIPEPDNPLDPNAIAVAIDGMVIGYLTRATALAYKHVATHLLRRSAVGSCTAEIRGGWRRPGGDEGYFGVLLDLAPPTFFRDQDFA